MQLQRGICQHTGETRTAERRPNAPDENVLGFGSRYDESSVEDVIAGQHLGAGRDVGDVGGRWGGGGNGGISSVKFWFAVVPHVHT